ncbi:MAG: hypothetical protein WC264_02790 [Candidatus Paceibacterota bacterium]|jgi:hypothetical protein
MKEKISGLSKVVESKKVKKSFNDYKKEFESLNRQYLNEDINDPSGTGIEAKFRNDNRQAVFEKFSDEINEDKNLSSEEKNNLQKLFNTEED